MKRIILIDSHAIIHRAYHALPPLTAPNSESINAVYGFTTILLRILRELKPDYIAAAFDLPGPTFRSVAYERYKAQRPETPGDLSGQFPKVEEVLSAFNIPVFKIEGYEADDIIGTIAEKLKQEKGIEVIVVTGDMDTFQLVCPGLKVYSMKKGISETVIYDEKAVFEKYGLKPSQLIDFKGLRGDPSDNIPGVKGIGEKTATELLKKFGSIEGVYKTLKKKDAVISVSVATKLREGEEDAKFSRELARIKLDVPIEFELDSASWGGWNEVKIRAVFQKFGFYSLLKRLDFVEEGKKDPPRSAQMTLPTGNVGENPTGYSRVDSGKKVNEFVKGNSGGEVGLILSGGELFLITPDGLVSSLDKKLLSGAGAKKFFGTANDFFCHDAKSLIKFLRGFGIEPRVFKFDIVLAAYLVEPFTRDFSYEAILQRELGVFADGGASAFSNFFAVKKSLEAKLEQGKIKSVFYEIELPLVRVLADLEDRGILLDTEFLKNLSKKVGKDLEKITKEIYKLAGEEFNVNSSQQLSRIIFDKLGIKTAGLRKTAKGGVVSTRESELEKLKNSHQIIPKILDYRGLAKLKNTYIDVLPELVSEKTRRLHTTFNQTGTSTGRLSSSDPNLQNIPTMSGYGKEIRKAFVASPGFLLASFDYSQIELRVAAHIAGDKKMIEAFRKGLDIHKMTAAEVYNVSLDKVAPELRRAAKTLNFGVLYGMGPQAFAESTGMSLSDAKKFIEEYFREFAGIKNYIERTKTFAEENGYVETIFGRRRYIPEINSSNWQLKRETERMAVNMPIQGSSTGDVIKIAMIKVDEWVRRNGLEKEVLMLLQVHDELLFEIKESVLEKTAPRIKQIMENIVTLKVPLVVDVKAGKNWEEQKAFEKT